jgi:hypothetical protein
VLAGEILPPDIDCIVLVADTLEPQAELRMTAALQRLQSQDRDCPLIVFTVPHRVDGWPIQAIDTDGTDFANVLAPAVRQAVRRHGVAQPYSPPAFISYARRDFEIVSSYLFAFREKCWLDREYLRPGVLWATELNLAIERADTFVLFSTPSYRLSSYCPLKLDHAQGLGKRILIVTAGAALPRAIAQKVFPQGLPRERAIADYSDVTFVTNEAATAVAIVDDITDKAKRFGVTQLIENLVDFNAAGWRNVLRRSRPKLS